MGERAVGNEGGTVKRPRPDLIGIDFARIVREGAKEMHRQGEESLIKRERDAKHAYEQLPEIGVLVFQERSNPPLWRMETVKEGPNGMGIVKVWDPAPAFLQAEMRVKLAGVFEVYDVCETSAEARRVAGSIRIREMGTIRLKDSERFEGERSS
jgi:hypothetical protein